MEHRAKQVQVPHLSWERDVAPILERAGVETEGLAEGQRRLLSPSPQSFRFYGDW